MSEKNKNKKFNTAFLVLFFPVCALFLYTLYLVIRRPDVIHTFWLLLMSVLIILNFFWMQTGFFEDRNDLNRRIAEWDKRRREAIHGESLRIRDCILSHILYSKKNGPLTQTPGQNGEGYENIFA